MCLTIDTDKPKPKKKFTIYKVFRYQGTYGGEAHVVTPHLHTIVKEGVPLVANHDRPVWDTVHDQRIHGFQTMEDAEKNCAEHKDN